jgi:hypothetical protein
MGAFTYGGTFEQIMNEFCSPQNVAATAKKFKELEAQYAPYTFGKFVKYFLKNPAEFANWDGDAASIPEPIRKRLAEVISTNLNSANPFPMLLKVGDNVDSTHDLIVKVFTHNNYIYIGLHMLCPNPKLG